MIATLTPEQRQAISICPTGRLRLVDPESERVYVLLPAEEYDRLQDEYSIRDTYAAQVRAAMRAGWDDPAMDDYNDYDASFQRLCRSNEATSS